VAQERAHLDKKLAQEMLEWPLAQKHSTREMWRRKTMRGDKVSVERGREKRSK